MQKSGIKFFYIVPRTIVPLDSAVVNPFVPHIFCHTHHFFASDNVAHPATVEPPRRGREAFNKEYNIR